MKSRNEIILVGMLIVVLFVIVVMQGVHLGVPTSVHTYTNFASAAESEMREIDDFYGFQPEMISIGKVFDLKIVSSYELLPFEGGKADYGVYLSLAKKIEEDIGFSMHVEYYGGDNLVASNYFGKCYLKERHKGVCSPIGLLDGYNYYADDLIFVTTTTRDLLIGVLIDKMLIRVEYVGGEEIHVLNYDSELSNNLMHNLLRSSYTSQYDENFYSIRIGKTVSRIMRAMIEQDFEKWHQTTSYFLEKYINDPSSFEAVVLGWYPSAFFPSERIDEVLSEEYTRYMKIVKIFEEVKDD